MASPLVDAVMANVIQSMDPNIKIVSDLMKAQTATSNLELMDRKAETISRIEALVTGAKDRNADPSVLEAYERLLKQVTA